MVDTPMPLTAHLAELRLRLIWCMVALVVGFSVCYTFSEKIVAALKFPPALIGKPIEVPLQIIAPAEAFTTQLWVSFIAGLFLALPVLLHQLWKFVAPGLFEHERRYTVPFIIGSAVLFYSGGLVFYLVLSPIMNFLFSYDAKGLIKVQLSVRYHVDFCIRLMIAFGLVFQLPIVAAFLTQLGLLSSRLLVKNFRYAIILILIAAAVLTPSPDPITFVFLAMPMLLPYGVSILVTRGVETHRARRQVESHNTANDD